MQLRKLLLLICLLFHNNLYAELTIRITQGVGKQTPVAIVPFGLGDDMSELGVDIADIISNDLKRSGRFSLTPIENMLQKPTTGAGIDFDDWSILGIEAVVVGRIIKMKEGSFNIQFQLFDIFKGEQIVGYRMPANEKTLRRSAHRIADMIYKELTGIRGVFDTKVAYVKTNVSRNETKYSLIVADSDGENEQIVVTSNDPIMSPAWSPDSRQIAYVSFENHRPEIFIQTLATGERVKLVNGNVSSSAPAWSPNEKFMAYTSSVNGNLEIFVHNFLTKNNIRVTNSLGIDTEAEWGLKSKKIFFTSDRNGNPHIYSKLFKKGKAKRITFDGTYNADANLSSDGKYLSLVHNNGNGHKIAIYSIKDKFLKVISKGRLDEAPSFSPNGKMVLFASKKLHKGILVATSNDGRIRKEIELTGEDVREPIWSH